MPAGTLQQAIWSDGRTEEEEDHQRSSSTIKRLFKVGPKPKRIGNTFQAGQEEEERRVLHGDDEKLEETRARVLWTDMRAHDANA